MVAGTDSIDVTLRQTYGYAKQGAGRGYTGVKGLNALLAAVSTRAGSPAPPDAPPCTYPPYGRGRRPGSTSQLPPTAHRSQPDPRPARRQAPTTHRL